MTTSNTQGVAVSIDEAFSAWSDEMTGRGCQPPSIARMTRQAEMCAEYCGWQTTADINYREATAYLADKRRTHGWAGTTTDQAVSSLKVWGEFCRKAGYCPTNPLADLTPTGEGPTAGAFAHTPEQARQLLISGLLRHAKSKRARGSGPMFWALMYHTGLRYSEAASIEWRHIDGLGTDDACIWTDPKWLGNKSKKRNRIPLSPMLRALLPAWKSTVGTKLVLPKPPRSVMFAKDALAAGIPETNARGEECSPHACRKSFATWLRGAGVDEAMVSVLLRHAPSLAGRTYIQLPDEQQRDAENRAICTLPNIWPGDNPSFSDAIRFSVRQSEKSACKPPRVADTSGVKQADPMQESTTQSDRQTPGTRALHRLLDTSAAGECSGSAGLISQPSGGIRAENGYSQRESALGTLIRIANLLADRLEKGER